MKRNSGFKPTALTPIQAETLFRDTLSITKGFIESAATSNRLPDAIEEITAQRDRIFDQLIFTEITKGPDYDRKRIKIQAMDSLLDSID